MNPLTKQKLVNLVLGVVIGISISSFYWLSQEEEQHPLATIPSMPIAELDTQNTTDTPKNTTEVTFSTNNNWNLIQTAYMVASALETQDFVTLCSVVHKEKGVRFTPYSTVNLNNDVVLTATQIKNSISDSNTYHWGSHVASGENIQMTIKDYFARFVSPLSYTKAPNITIDSVLLSGNALENVAECYPDCRFVDFSFRSIDPELSGADWSSLKLVFQAEETAWYLVGIIHSERTV